jgi:hypothetical protein
MCYKTVYDIKLISQFRIVLLNMHTDSKWQYCSSLCNGCYHEYEDITIET